MQKRELTFGLVSLFLAIAAFATVASCQRVAYVDSEYQGWFPTGDIGTPFRTIESSLTSICKAARKYQKQILLFRPRPTPYLISSALLLRDCGTVEMKALPSSDENEVNISFQAPLQLNNSNFTFDSFKFSGAATGDCKLPSHLMAFSSEFTFRNCTFNTTCDRFPSNFLDFAHGNLTIEDSRIRQYPYSTSNAIVYSKTRINEFHIDASNSSKGSLFEFYGTSMYDGGQSFDNNSNSSWLKVSRLNITKPLNEHKTDSSHDTLFELYNITAEFDTISILGANLDAGAIYLYTELKQGFITYQTSAPSRTLTLKNFEFHKIVMHFPVLSYRCFANDSHVQLKSIVANNVDIFAKVGMFHFMINGHNGGVEIDDIKFGTVKTNSEVPNTLDLSNTSSLFNINHYSGHLNMIHLARVELLNCLLHSSFVLINGPIKNFVMENISVNSVTFYATFINFQGATLVDSEAVARLNETRRLVQNVEIANVIARRSFIVLRSVQSIADENYHLRQLEYFDFKQIVAKGVRIQGSSANAWVQDSVVTNSCPAFFSLNNMGVKVRQSRFQGILLADSHFTLVSTNMVPVWFGESVFHGFEGKFRNSRFFWKSENDFNLETLYEFNPNPLFTSLVLTNNTFSGSWNFGVSSEIFVLNVANAFIINNTFENITFNSGSCVFCADTIYGDHYVSTQNVKNPEKFAKFLVDPDLKDIIYHYSNQTDPEKNISSFVVFDRNDFKNVQLLSTDLFSIQKLLPSISVLLFQNNLFINISNVLQGKEQFSTNSVLYVKDNPHTVVRQNFVLRSNSWIKFFEAKKTFAVEDSEIDFYENYFDDNQGMSVFILVGESLSRIQFSRNIIRDSSLSDSLISMWVRVSLLNDLFFDGNILENISIDAENYIENYLLILNFPTNVGANIIINDQVIRNCSMFYPHLEQSSGPRSSLIHIMNPKANLAIQSSLITGNLGVGLSFLMMLYSNAIVFRDNELLENPSASDWRSGSWLGVVLLAANEATIYNSLFWENIGVFGGAFHIENLLSRKSKMMKISIYNNTFMENYADYGAALYFSTLNLKLLHMEISNNDFINNLAFIEGGALHLEKQLISRLRITDCEFIIESSSFDPSYLFHLHQLANDKESLDDTIIIQNIKAFHQTAPSHYKLNSIGCLMSFSILDQASNHISLLVSNFTFTHMDDPNSKRKEDKYLELNVITALSGLVTIDNLNISGLRTSQHIIKATTNARVIVKNSLFHKNQMTQTDLSLPGCVIAIETTDPPTEDNSYLIISNTTFSNNTLDDIGASLICMRAGTFNITVTNDTKVFGNANKGPVFFDADDQRLDFVDLRRTLRIFNSTFHANKGLTKYGSVLNVYAVNLEIEDSVFLNNHGAHRGGAIAMHEGHRLNILRTEFISNAVNKSRNFKESCQGGAIYFGFEFDAEIFSKFSIKKSRFIGNEAVVGQGGAIFSNTMIEPANLSNLKSNNVFEGNIATAGDDVSTRPTAMKLILQSKNPANLNQINQIKNEGMISGMISSNHFQDSVLNFTFFDFFGNPLSPLVDLENPPYYTLILKNPTMNETITSRNCNYGWCTISGDSLLVRGKGNEIISLNATLMLDTTGITTQAKVDFVMKAQIRPCLKGEINTTTKGMCVKCEADSYSLDTSDTVCHECPTGFKCLGGSEIILKRGYWRLNSTSDKAYACNPPELCNRTNFGEFGNEVCSEGYAGHLCQACDLQNGYTPGLGTSCSKCNDSWLALVPMIGFNLVLFCFEIWYIWRMRRINTALIIENRFKQEYVEKLARGGYLSIFLQYAQIIAIIRTLPSFAMEFVQSLIPISNPSQAIVFSTDCTLRYFGIPVEDIYYWKMAVVGGLPFLKVAIFAAFGGILKLLRPNFHFVSYIAIVCIGITLIEQPGIIYSMVSIFSCKSIDPTNPSLGYFITSAPLVTCGTGVPVFEIFRYYIAVPLLIFWGLFIPVIFSIVLLKNRHRLRKKEFAVYFGSLYSGFNRKHFMWRLVQMLINIIMTILSQLGTIEHTARGMTIVVFLILYLMYLRRAKPYRFEDLYRTDLIATSIYVITTFFAVYGAVSEAWLNYTVGVGILILNFCFIIFVILKSFELVGLQKVAACVLKLLNYCFCGVLGENSEEAKYNRIQPSDSIADRLTPNSMVIEGESEGSKGDLSATYNDTDQDDIIRLSK